jgi:predicted acetyltransferase
MVKNPSTPLNISVSPAQIAERHILRNLLELYQYDFSEFDGSDTGSSGLYDYPHLDDYWVEPERTPFLVRVNGQLAGFALVTRYNYLTGLNDAWILAEFFVMRKYRHQGVGEFVASHIFNQFQGEWQVAQIPENVAAIAFWRKVIARFTNNTFIERDLNNDNWRGPVQMFTSLPATMNDAEKNCP